MKHNPKDCIVCNKAEEILLADRRVSSVEDRRGERGDRRKPQATFGDIDPDETLSMEDLEIIR